MITQQKIAEAYQPLFDLMESEYGQLLLKSEMDEIISVVDKVNENLTELFRNVCDVEGCEATAVSGGCYYKEAGHISLCDKHTAMGRKGEPMPALKQEAIEREASRGADGILPIFSMGF